SHVARRQYDSSRTPDLPSSAALVERYGSWRNVCRHAHHLVTGGPNRLRKHRRHASSKIPRRYSEQDAIAAVRECAREINRPPSTSAYRAWRVPAEQRRRGNATYPSTSAVLRLYADRGGWLAALEVAGLIQPPAMTVRVITPSK